MTECRSCCVDEVAAEHCQADCIIHFGHSCLSPTTRLPSLLVLDKHALDTAACTAQIKTALPERDTPVLLLYDAAYFYAIGNLHRYITMGYYGLYVTMDLS